MQTCMYLRGNLFEIGVHHKTRGSVSQEGRKGATLPLVWGVILGKPRRLNVDGLRMFTFRIRPADLLFIFFLAFPLLAVILGRTQRPKNQRQFQAFDLVPVLLGLALIAARWPTLFLRRAAQPRTKAG